MSGRARRGALPEREVVREVEGDGERQRIPSGTQIASLRRIGFNRRALKLQVVCCVSVLLVGELQRIAVRERPYRSCDDSRGCGARNAARVVRPICGSRVTIGGTIGLYCSRW